MTKHSAAAGRPNVEPWTPDVKRAARALPRRPDAGATDVRDLDPERDMVVDDDLADCLTALDGACVLHALSRAGTPRRLWVPGAAGTAETLAGPGFALPILEAVTVECSRGDERLIRNAAAPGWRRPPQGEDDRVDADDIIDSGVDTITYKLRTSASLDTRAVNLVLRTDIAPADPECGLRPRQQMLLASGNERPEPDDLEELLNIVLTYGERTGDRGEEARHRAWLGGLLLPPARAMLDTLWVLLAEHSDLFTGPPAAKTDFLVSITAGSPVNTAEQDDADGSGAKGAGNRLNAGRPCRATTKVKLAPEIRTPANRSQTLLALTKFARACRTLGREEGRAGHQLGRETVAYNNARETARETVRGILDHPGGQGDASIADNMLHHGPTESETVETTRTPVLDLGRMASRADALGKAESEHWYYVPEHKRARVLEILNDRNDAFEVLSGNKHNVLAAEATIDGRVYRLSYRDTARLDEPVLIFMSAGGAHRTEPDTVVAAMRARNGSTPVILTIPLQPASEDGDAAGAES